MLDFCNRVRGQYADGAQRDRDTKDERDHFAEHNDEEGSRLAIFRKLKDHRRARLADKVIE
ncbi:hypothetical protein JQ631_24915 [Bradyrhizobium manausense]|uniref:hypothetical protein n=1 Tax=Bradyrhizobium manausense TaxID=989370 RepID=UPI001BA90C75|nr:hypothetical protein [Bradyrhizobium manausense]MBR0792340.1 hypothetical protein [Bradyrhizobium manausense]